MILSRLAQLCVYLYSWWNPGIDPVADALPTPQAHILITLEDQLQSSPHFDDLPTAKELYDRLHPYTRGEYYEFIADLGILNTRMFITWEDEEDRVLISPRGSHIARECKRKFSNA